MTKLYVNNYCIFIQPISGNNPIRKRVDRQSDISRAVADVNIFALFMKIALISFADNLLYHFFNFNIRKSHFELLIDPSIDQFCVTNLL